MVERSELEILLFETKTTQKEAAEMIGKSHATMRAYCSAANERNITAEDLERLKREIYGRDNQLPEKDGKSEEGL